MCEKNVISFINMKGGVGKTTLCIGIGEYLAHYHDLKILFIDLDPQFNTTQSLMNEFDLEDKYMTEYIKNDQTVVKIFNSPAKITEKHKMPTVNDIVIELDNNMHVILGTIDLIFQDGNKSASTAKRLSKFIEDNKLRKVYDFIFIDCPPTISLFTDAGLMASDYYLVPNRIDRYSILGIKLLSQVIDRLKYDENLTIEPFGVIYTMLDKETLKTKKLRETFEKIDIVKDLYIFENGTKNVADLRVGLQGNISSKYTKSRSDMEQICQEFIERAERNA